MSGAWIVPRGRSWIAIEGELDFESVTPLLAETRRQFAGKERLEIDMQGVRRADSAGLALLVGWLALARRHGVSLRFHSPPDALMRLAEVTNVAELLPVVKGGA
jgi:phospholipid transport system transporter-binding protein